MRLARLWAEVREFFSHSRLEEARKRHQTAADRLDAAVKELLRK